MNQMSSETKTILIFVKKLKCIESILVDIKPASVANDIALTKITEFLNECNTEMNNIFKNGIGGIHLGPHKKGLTEDVTMQDINDMSVQSEMDAKSGDYPNDNTK